MKVLVTGGAGFIGNHVAIKLLARGDDVVIVDNVNNYYDVQIKRDRLKRVDCPVYEIDFSDYDALAEVFTQHQFDVVCHLGAQAGVRYSLENPFAYERTNSLGTLNILELMRKHNCKKLVYASSSSVYGGNEKTPFSVEDRVDHPISLYAATKKYNELMAHVYYNLFGIESFGLRFFTVYGPWGRPDMALFKFTKNMIENKPIDVYNNGDHARDFTYIDDIVRGVILSIDKVSGYDVLNLGNNKVTTLMQFIGCIEKELGIVAQKNMLPMQPGDVHTTSADIEHTKKVLGWEPRTNVDEGIKHFIEWYRSYYA